jgi:hypothetical protein
MRALRNPSAPLLLFAGAALACWVLLLVLGSRLTFISDDWAFLIFRRGFGAHQVFDPHNEHIAVIPVLTYKAVLGAFGMTSQQPFRAVSIPVFLTSVVLLFVWLRRRVGDWLALAGVLPILFLGSSGEILLWPFPQLGFCGPMAAGLGAFLALERRDRKGDLTACGLLALSVLWGSLGLAFVAGALVHVAWDRARWRRRAFVVAVPLGVYAVWWLGWGHQAESHLSLHNLALSPLYVFNGLASGVASLLALPQIDLSATTSLDLGAPLLVLLAAVAVVRVRRLGHVSRWLAVVTGTTLAFWFPAALIASDERHPTDPRYQYAAAIFTLLIAAELARGVRLGRRAMVVAFAIAGFATLGNLAFLRDAYWAERSLGQRSRGGLAGLEIGRGVIHPKFGLIAENSGVASLGLVSAAYYYAAIDDYGSPAYSPATLRSAPEAARVVADTVLWRGLPATILSGETTPAGHPPELIGGGSSDRRGSCLTVRPSGGGPIELLLPAGGISLRLSPGEAATMLVRRYADQPKPVGDIPAGGGALVMSIPADRSAVPWRLTLEADGAKSICGIGAG